MWLYACATVTQTHVLLTSLFVKQTVLRQQHQPAAWRKGTGRIMREARAVQIRASITCELHRTLTETIQVLCRDHYRFHTCTDLQLRLVVA